MADRHWIRRLMPTISLAVGIFNYLTSSSRQQVATARLNRESGKRHVRFDCLDAFFGGLLFAPTAMRLEPQEPYER